MNQSGGCLEALLVDDATAGIVVFAARNQHLLEYTDGCED
jgi:hypothetical protein